MENNIFSFANTYWLQLTHTAMGTPVACAYATVTFGQYENTTILPKYVTTRTYQKDMNLYLYIPQCRHTPQAVSKAL